MSIIFDVLMVFLKVILAIGVIDAFLLIVLYRVRVLNRNIDRRAQAQELKQDLKKQERTKKEKEACQSARDDNIMWEMDRFYGAPW